MIAKGTHCKSGRHELTDENIYVSNGHRGCKLCKLEYYKDGRPVKRLERLIETHNIIMSEVWRASELVRLKQSIESCYLAEIRAAQRVEVSCEREIHHSDQVEIRRISA